MTSRKSPWRSSPGRWPAASSWRPWSTSCDRCRVSIELLTVGRVGVDLYPEQSGVPLGSVLSFAKSLGGTATNVAVAAARLGRRSGVLTKVGPDAFGGYVRDALRGFGVSADFVGTSPDLLTPVVF